MDKVNWDYLSLNPNAIHILEDNLDKVKWNFFSSNPNIFTYDYEAIHNVLYKEDGFVEEFIQKQFHPKNMDKWDGWGFPTE